MKQDAEQVKNKSIRANSILPSGRSSLGIRRRTRNMFSIQRMSQKPLRG